VRHISGHRLVALIEVMSPANKDRRRHLDEFVEKVLSALELGVNVLIVDVFPPGSVDPAGIHGAIQQFVKPSEEPYELPANKPLMLASYVAGGSVEGYLEHIGVGAELPPMPLFLCPERYVNVPLEPTYMAAYAGMPAYWRDILESPSGTSP